MDRKMLDYIPPVLHDVRDFVCILGAMENEIRDLWAKEERQEGEYFVDSCQGAGLRRWEEILRITPRPDSSVELRRQIVLARLRQVPPYCFRTFRRLLSGLFGTDEGFTVELDGLRLSVRLQVRLWEFEDAVRDMMRYIVPANIETRLILSMMTHGRLGGRTHRMLAAYTHSQLQRQ